MTNETILTDEAIYKLVVDFENECNCDIETYPADNIVPFARAIEQAILESPEIQALKDALRELISIVEIHSSVTKNNFAWAELDEAKSAIAAMEKQP